MPFEEVSGSKREFQHAEAVPGAQTHRFVEMLDRQVALADNVPQRRAPAPATGETRIKGERTVNHSDRDVYVLAKKSEHCGTICEDFGVIAGPLRPPRQIERLTTVRLRLQLLTASR